MGHKACLFYNQAQYVDGKLEEGERSDSFRDGLPFLLLLFKISRHAQAGGLLGKRRPRDGSFGFAAISISISIPIPISIPISTPTSIPAAAPVSGAIKLLKRLQRRRREGVVAGSG